MAKSLIRYVMPGAAQKGIVSKVIVPAGVLVGGYIVVSKLTGFNPLGDAAAGAAGALEGTAKAIGDAVGTISKPVGDAITAAGATLSNLVVQTIVQTGALRFSKNPVLAGDVIHVTMAGLQPFQDVRIVWTEADLDSGAIRADISGKIDIVWTIPNITPKMYQVNATVTYIAGDQRVFASNITVISNDTTPPPPPPPGIETIRGEATRNPWDNLTSGSVVTLTYQLVKYVDNVRVGNAAISGKQFATFLDGNIVSIDPTNSTGKFVFMFGVGAYGLQSGEHSLDVYPYPYDANKDSDRLLAATGRIVVA